MNLEEREVLRKAVHDDKLHVLFSVDGQFGSPASFRRVMRVDLPKQQAWTGPSHNINLVNASLWMFLAVKPLSIS